MKRTTFFKSLLLAAGLSVGANAWADNVYTILYGVPTYDTDNTTIKGVTPQTDFTSTDGTTASDITHTDANGSKCDGAMPVGGSVLSSATSFSKHFETVATKGIVHFEANYTATTNGQEQWKVVDSNGVEIFGTTDSGKSNGNATMNWGYCNGVSLGTNWFRQARGGHNRVVLDINLTAKVVSYTVLVSSGNNSYSTLTGTYDLPEGVVDVSGLTATKQSYNSYMDYVSFYNVYDNSVSEAAYTINYQLNNVTVVSETGSGAVGSTINAQYSIWNDGNTQKYFAASNATTSFTISEGTNTFNVAVREAEVWSYTIKAMDGTTELGTIATNNVVEGETANYGYPQYFAAGGKLYVSGKQGGNPWWGKSFTPSKNNESQEISYSEEGTDGIVFCEEAENISTLTSVTGGNTDIRASNRAGAYASADAVIVTLPAGKYKMSGAVYGNAGTTFNFMAGSSVVLSIATSGNPVHTVGEEFVLAEETDITVLGGNGGNSPKIIDYVFIQRTGDAVVPVSVAEGKEFATFNCDYALDFSGVTDIIAYTAKLNATGSSVTFTKVAGAVPANTGLLIRKADKNSANVPVVASATAVDNDFIAVTAANCDAEKDYKTVKEGFILATVSGEQGFYKANSTDGTQVGKGKAYLPATGASARLTMNFGEEATGISDVRVATVDNAIYNLNGVRVAQPQKGLYIVNGKKMIIK